MAGKSNKGKIHESRAKEPPQEEAVDLAALLEAAGEPDIKPDTVRPVVTHLPVNFRVVMCQVDPHRNGKLAE